MKLYRFSVSASAAGYAKNIFAIHMLPTSREEISGRQLNPKEDYGYRI
jgi:hypothetical protein